MFKYRQFYLNGILFSVIRVPKTNQLWYWKASRAMSGRAYTTYKAAKAAAEQYLLNFGDTAS
jgi:hypothetical protein